MRSSSSGMTKESNEGPSSSSGMFAGAWYGAELSYMTKTMCTNMASTARSAGSFMHPLRIFILHLPSNVSLNDGFVLITACRNLSLLTRSSAFWSQSKTALCS
ncbi:hypothetical protein PM082_019258 [Marasmius tenuissimus]|nr:hypothetical protein PM082_019258 [Marasmius tenuissimus]